MKTNSKKHNLLKIFLITLLNLVLLVVALYAGVRLYLKSVEFPRPPKVNERKKHIACIGDSITYGAGVLGKRRTSTYPVYLQGLVGNDWQVLNYGLSGRTLMDSGDVPYTKEEMYPETIACKADIYIVMLGTNDAKSFNWDAESFEHDLTAFLKPYIEIAEADNVYVIQPAKCFAAKGETEIRHGIKNENVIEVCEIIERVSDTLHVNVIDLYSFTEGHPEWFPDGIHPNAEGNREIADYIYEHLDLEK